MVAQMERWGNIAAVAREHDIRTSLLGTWRRELRYALEATRPVEHEAGLAFILMVADCPKALSDDVAIEVEVAGAVVRIGRAAKSDLAIVVLKALQVPR
jgi:transposase